MDLMRIGSAEVRHEVTGHGPLVVLLHARPFVDWYGPLVPLLAGCSVLRYRRTIDGGDDTFRPPFDIGDDAAIVEQLLESIGAAPAHLVGHSYGGLLALELARRRHVDIRSLALLEPAASGLAPPARAAAGVAPLMETGRRDGAAAAMRQFLSAIGGDGFADALDAVVPSGVETACRHAGPFLDVELPAVVAWEYGADDAAALTAPVLLMAGTDSDRRFVEAVELLQTWIAHAERVDVPGADHLLMAAHPAAVADALATFWRSA